MNKRAASARRGRTALTVPPANDVCAASRIARLMPADLTGRSLVSMRSHTPEEVELLLDLAAEARDQKRRGERPLRRAGRNIAIVFLKPSTRTRAAFVVAAADEGAHPEVLRAEDIRFGVKESIADIARVLGRLYDGIAFRGFGDDVVEALVDHAGVPVWNALTEG